MLKDIKFKTLYSSGEKESPVSFFSQALSNSVRFDLGLGFFSSASINVLNYGFAKFISNGGRMRLYINQFLSDEDFRALTSSPSTIEEKVIQDFHALLKVLSKRNEHFFNCLSYLIYTDRISIRIVIPKTGGIAHQKFGIFTDADGDQVAFNGSLNMTASALLSKNIETISCIFSWKGGEDAIQEYEEVFKRFFEGNDENVTVIPAERLTKEIVKAFPSKEEKQLIEDEEELSKELSFTSQRAGAPEEPRASSEPRFPYPTGAFDYQKEAYQNWKNNGCTGIFAMATGTGKTITSLNCALEEYRLSGKYRILILVPSNDLVNQWIVEVGKFNYQNIYVVNGKVDWRRQLIELRDDFSYGIESNYVIISTYASFTNPTFQSLIQKLNEPEMILIADEAHNVGSEAVRKAFDVLPISKRIALSATPNRVYDPEGTAAIESYFHDIPPYCYSFSMERAIREKRLMHYMYYPKLAFLDSDEMGNYLKLTKRLLTFYAPKAKNFTDSPEVQELLMRRKRIIHKAKDKYRVFSNIVDEVVDLDKAHYCFVYTPEGVDYESGDEERIINKMQAIVSKSHPEIKTNTFLGGDSEKKDKLKAFAEGKIDMLFAMKCLDEGVDVPRAEVGIFTSSTGNPRQFIQRRGRLLRKHPDKNFAYIYDTIVVPDFKNYPAASGAYEMERSLVRNEMMRVAYFASLSDNYWNTVNELSPVLSYYNLEISTLISELQTQ